MPGEREQLVEVISEKINWDDDISRALDYALNVEHTDKSRPRSVDVAKRVLEMGTDRNTLIATLLSDPELRGVLDTKEIEQEFGKKTALLTQDVNRLNTLQDCNQSHFKTPEQAEKLRRLLMAIISDVRVMLIKLCYRVERLKLLKHNSYEERRCIAQETLDIFAPLANRLGMGLIKWEMEDLAFRALEPLAFKKIATLLEQKRSEREAFIEQFKAQLGSMLLEQEIKARVSGRVKHIVSIWRKMQNKNLEFHEFALGKIVTSWVTKASRRRQISSGSNRNPDRR